MEFAYTSAKAKCAACGKAVPMRGLAVGRDGGDGLTRWLHLQCAAPVSYTHLTLPTILLV